MSDNAEQRLAEEFPPFGFGHEPFDFGITLDGVHHESIRCRACTQAWPCLAARHFEALAALEALGRALHWHRTATHRVAPTYCTTCRESDAAIAAAGRALGVGKGEQP